jgi:hypothetical protein
VVQLSYSVNDNVNVSVKTIESSSDNDTVNRLVNDTASGSVTDTVSGSVNDSQYLS